VKNPYRYRGYRYDSETGLYYLQSRYYNPEWGRFLNADGLTSTGQGFIGNNMFVYCLNNPASNKDNNGYLSHYVMADGGGRSKNTVVEKVVYILGKVAEGTGDYFIGEGTAKAYKNSVRNSWKPRIKYTSYGEITTFKNVPKALNVANKACKWGLGAIAVGSTMASIWDNHQNYDSETALKRDGIDVGAFILGCVAGAVISTFALPGVAVAAIGIVAGTLISVGADEIKKSISN